MTVMRRTIELTDPRALRAVAHPVRLALIGALRRQGPLTATQAGGLIGESATTCSFHLRQLAKYGLVEEAGGGRGRERPWRATAWFTSWPGAVSDPKLAAAVELLNSVVAERYFDRVLRWLERQAEEPPEWQDAAHFGDTIGYVTAAELGELRQRIDDLLEPYGERMRNPELRPADARLVTFIRLAFPENDGSKGP
jgi:predicted ArsR family transcriptional regulator